MHYMDYDIFTIKTSMHYVFTLARATGSDNAHIRFDKYEKVFDIRRQRRRGNKCKKVAAMPQTSAQ